MKTLLIGGAVAALAVPALAQIAPAPTPAPRAAHAQKVQTRAEVQAKVAQHFARLDANRDGVLTQAEVDTAKQARKTKVAERREQAREHRLRRLESNNDGSISRAEWDAAQAHRRQRVAARDHDGDGRRDRRGARGAGMHGFGGRMFAMADADKDGRVTLAEAHATALQHFDMIDANRDGRITPEERTQMHQRMRAGRPHG